MEQRVWLGGIAFFVLMGAALGFSLTHKKKNTVPRLTVVMVIDQFAYHYMYKLKPFLTGGLKDLFENGINFTQAAHPHGIPSTAMGHAAIGCGAYAKHHGIVGNTWVNSDGKVIPATYDAVETAGIFKPDGISTYEKEGVSSAQLMVDNLADSFVLSALSSQKKTMSFSFSFKSRAAVMMGGKMGKAFWFDDKSGGMTSSKAYFDKLPSWLLAFNEKHRQPAGTMVEWKPRYDLTGPAYAFSSTENYEHSALKQMCNQKVPIEADSKEFAAYDFYEKTPLSDKLVLDAALSCLDANFSDKKNDACLLWVSLSSLDLAGHYYGCHTLEAIDTVYHLDTMIGDFMKVIRKKYPHAHPLFVITGDHGVMPIPEVLNEQGYALPVRVDSTKLIKDMNDIAHKEFDVDGLIVHDKAPMFYFDKKKFAALECEKRCQILCRLSDYLRSNKYIKHVWSISDFENPTYPAEPLAELFYNQYYPGRSGELVCLSAPYCMLTAHAKGTGHDTPYLYDRHVPLALWQPGIIEKKTVEEPVSMLQLAPSLAHILQIKVPSAAEEKILPIFNQK